MRTCSPPPTINSSRGMTVPVCGGLETYNERSFCVKYRSQGVQTSFYESTPSAADSLGDTISPGDTEDPGNARANLPNASKERNFRNIYRHSRVLFERIPVEKGDYAFKIDLQDAYFHVLIHPDSRKYRKFCV